jgi:hypothetical protein
MEFISASLKDVITYEEERDIYKRKESIPMMKKNKQLELFSIIETLTGEKINVKNWEYRGDCKSCYELYDSDQDCICSENDCRHIFYKTHKRTGFTFKLGSQCILKFHDNEKEKKEEETLHTEIIRNFKKETCKYIQCEEKVLDKRKKHCKDGYCSLECKENAEIPQCICGVRARSNVSKKRNENYGRRFFNCGNSRRDYDGKWINGCGFFKWT